VFTENLARVVTGVSAEGTIEELFIEGGLDVIESFLLESPNTLVYSSETPSFIFDTVFFQPPTTLRRFTQGVGTESNPFLPVNPNWTLTIIPVTFPIFWWRPTFCDPPYAKGFDYKVASGKSQRVEKVYAPLGFGKKIKVYAATSRNGRPKLVGTVASGKNLDLTRAKGLSSGAAYIRMRGMKPRPDLSEQAPYPVGFTFLDTPETTAEIEVIPLKK
jgi:hypothetical protein